MIDSPVSIPPSASHSSTNQVVFDLLKPQVRPNVKILDFGAGKGHMVARLANQLMQNGGNPEDSIVACDLDPDIFEVPGLPCSSVPWIDSLPWPDNHFDVAYSIEVIEHLENPYSFAREMLRVVKPGGKLVFTTPNIHHMTARWTNLFRGYPTQFGIVTFKAGDEGDWLGHVTPVVWTTLYSALHRAGASDIHLHVDRRKKSAVAHTIVAFPWVATAAWFYRRALATADPARRAAGKEFGDCMRQMASIDMLTTRSLVVEAGKPKQAGL